MRSHRYKLKILRQNLIVCPARPRSEWKIGCLPKVYLFSDFFSSICGLNFVNAGELFSGIYRSPVQTHIIQNNFRLSDWFLTEIFGLVGYALVPSYIYFLKAPLKLTIRTSMSAFLWMALVGTFFKFFQWVVNIPGAVFWVFCALLGAICDARNGEIQTECFEVLFWFFCFSMCDLNIFWFILAFIYNIILKLHKWKSGRKNFKS